VAYAFSEDGLELPVIDVAHPAFAIALGEPELAGLVDSYRRDEQRRARIPSFLQRLVVRFAVGRSRLGRGLLAGMGGVLSGMTIYLAKLGPDNLGAAWAGPVDRRIAAALPSVLARVRLEDVSRLLAEGLAPVLEARPGSPLHLVDIAGGPGADSWNALLLLRRGRPDLVRGRRVLIQVLDLDHDGPAFGARALAALRAPGAPLADVDVTFRHTRHDWRDVAALKSLLEETPDAVVAGSSEGGLFEYGSDEEILANLDTLRAATPADSLVTGSVTRKEGPVRPHFAVRPRSLDEFRALVARAGWVVSRAIERPLCYDVRLTRASV
jgi:hypothetical protein